MAAAGLMKNWVVIILLILLPLFWHFPCATDAYYGDFPSANPSVTWKNTTTNEKGSVDFDDGSTLRPILLVYNVTKFHPPFGLGFFTNRSLISTSIPNSGFYVVVFMMTGINAANNSNGEYQFRSQMPPQVLWSANRDSPVGENATLDFTAEGDLILRDEFGNPVWSTNTSTDYVARMEIDGSGNFMLLNGSNNVVWQSYDHPTDTWLPNQKIYEGQRLTASISSSNLSTGIYYLSVGEDVNIGMRAFLDSNPPEQYAILLSENSVDGLVGPAFGNPENGIGMGTHFTVLNGVNLATVYAVFHFNFTASPTDFRFMVLEPSGHLILYRVDNSYPYSFAVTPRSDLFVSSYSLGDCGYPAVCGQYGVCSGSGQCACPEDNNGSYFWPFEQGVGCAKITPLSCEDGSEYHTFVDLPNVTYFDFVPTLLATTVDECKEACLNNCSCKAALFRYDMDVSSGNCSLQSEELYSFMPSGENFGSFASIKVQKVPSRKKPAYLVRILAPSLVGGLLVVTFVGGMYYCCRMLENTDNEAEESDDQVTEALTKFSFEELKSCTQNFQIKLGQGGFGAVFKGVLYDSIKVAVKRLDSVGQGRKEFLAEVNTIDKVEHFHLVRLIGYCAEKSNRLLVYEYMVNGSLDKWIFDLDKARTLSWKKRQEIIYGVAKGLQYLHEECHKKIIHFDIKPQNILLDGDFNAKISDFGLAKLVDRNQSLVLTTLKGTVGYLAPEMFRGSNISVKADIYSFGIVILETICGRKNLHSSHESMPLIDMVKTKAKEDQLYDLIDDEDEDIWSHKEAAVKLIKLGIWCLQPTIEDPVCQWW